MNCPTCDAKVDAVETECPVCGAPLAANVTEESSAGCESCGGPTSPGHATCERCRSAPTAAPGSSTAATRSAGPSPRAWLIGAAAVVTLGVIALLVGGLLNRDESGSEAPVAAGPVATSEAPTATVTVTAAPSESTNDVSSPPAPGQAARSGPGSTAPPPGYSVYKHIHDVPGYYQNAGTLHPSTSQGFLEAVAAEYARMEGNGYAVELTAYSAARHENIAMSCRPQTDGNVLCTGGDRAAILLWNPPANDG